MLTQTLTTYDADGNPILVADKERFSTDTSAQTGPLGDPTTGPEARVYDTAYYYDPDSRLTAVVDVGTNGGAAYTRPGTVPARSDTALVTSFVYDAAGHVQTTTDPRGIVTRDGYDALGRVTQNIADYTNGTPTTSSNQTTYFGYDGLGNVLTVKAVMPSGTPSQTTKSVYGVTTASGSGINSNDLLATVEYPDPTTGSPSTSASNQESYTYDRLGDTTTYTDPNGTTHTYGYDVLGRPTSDAVTTLGAGVDGSVRRQTVAYNALGLPYLYTSYNAASGGSIVNQVQDVYNGLGQLTGEYQEQTGAVNTSTTPEVQYDYTEMSGGQNNSRLTQMVYPNGRTLDYVYNSGLDSTISRLSAIADDNAGTPGTTLEAYTYLGLNTIVQYAHPQDGINLTDIQQTGDTQYNNDGGDPYVGLDRFGRVIDQNWWNPTTQTSTDRFQYGYDRAGNVLYSNNLVNASESELYRSNSTASGDSNTAYDGLGRQVAFARGTLSSSGYNGTQLDTIASPSASQSWSLDALGNWSGVTTDGSTTTQTFNAQNQLTSVTGGTAPTFDNNGNTTSDAGLTYVYNAWNQLVTVKNGSTTVASYTYDALGRRITETDGSTTNHLYYSPQWQVIEERQNGTAATDVTDQYVWGAGDVDELVLRDTYTGGVQTQRLYAQWNANFDVTALVNTSGQVVERYLYDPYGSVTVTDASWNPLPGNTSAYGWRYLFQGGRLDTTTGWYDFRNRDLIPSEGRWAERDPIGFGGGELNLYEDTFSSPENYTDPLGLGPWNLLWTGNWNASPELWDAAMGGAAESTLHNAAKIETIADYASTVDPTATSGVIKSGMQFIQARDREALGSLAEAGANEFGGRIIGKTLKVVSKKLPKLGRNTPGALPDAADASKLCHKKPVNPGTGGPIQGSGGPGKVYEIPGSELKSKQPYIGKTRQKTVAERMKNADHRAKTPTGAPPNATTIAENLTPDEMAGVEALLIEQRGLRNLSNKIPGLNTKLPKNAPRVAAGKKLLGSGGK